MAETTQFTAAQVRYVKQMLEAVPVVFMDGVELDLAHVLDAFAQRLELDEQRITDAATGISISLIQAWDEASSHDASVLEMAVPILVEQAEQLREEGRREAITRLREQVSAQIACGLPASAEGLLKNVLMMVEETDWPSWLRAQSLTQPTETAK